MLQVNDEEATLSTVIHAGDHIRFIPARHGEAAHRTLEELLGPGFYGQVLVNNIQVPMDTPLEQGDVIFTMRQTPPAPAPLQAADPAPARPAATAPSAPAAPVPSRFATAPAQPAAVHSGKLHLTLNGKPLDLSPKEDGSPYYLMDLLEYSGIDFEHLDRTVRLEVNGVERGFQHPLKERDSVSITLA